MLHGKVQLSRKNNPCYKSRTCQIHPSYPTSQRSSNSHPDDFVRARTNTANLATDSAHPHARTYNPPANPPTHSIAMYIRRYSTMYIQRYSRTAAVVLCCAVVRTYSCMQRESTTHGGVFCKCSFQGKTTPIQNLGHGRYPTAEALPAMLTAKVPVNGLCPTTLLTPPRLSRVHDPRSGEECKDDE